MKITSLLENTTAYDNIKVEHGLSLYIETEQHRILFDMGQTDLFYQNALTLGIDLTKVDIAILSHGHYDHGGGLEKFLEVNTHAPVYIHKDAFLPHYNGTEKYIGLDVRLKDDPRIIFTDDKLCIDDSLTLYSCNDKVRKYDMLPSGLNEKISDKFIPDDFRHEQYLLIEENGKRVLISGCSHKGILDITSWFSPGALVGGFHYSKLSLDDYLIDAAKELADFPTEFYTCHCTGEEQYKFMKKYIPPLHYLSCGQIIII
ncbi:MAG: MBL fold metallo-hydrolase [Clostridia bacterium]|nr:MBL fold metallo-hydrolase [Clostridia bacterium]